MIKTRNVANVWIRPTTANGKVVEIKAGCGFDTLTLPELKELRAKLALAIIEAEDEEFAATK